MAVKCPNLSDEGVKKDFLELQESLGTFAYVVWDENNGNHIDKAPNGKPSELFKDLLDYSNSRRDAIRLKARAFGTKFKQKFGDWTVGEATELVDQNGEPLSFYLGNTAIAAESVIAKVLDSELRNKSASEIQTIEKSFDTYMESLKEVNDPTIQKVLEDSGNDWKGIVVEAFTNRAFAASLNNIKIEDDVESTESKSFWQRLKELVLGIISDDFTKFEELQSIVEEFFEISDQQITDQQVSFAKSNDLNMKVASLSSIKSPTLSDAIQNTDTALSQSAKSKLFRELDAKLKAFLSDVGVIYKGTFDTLLDDDGKPMSAIAKADLVAKVVEVVENKRDISTLPEEAAHVLIKLLDPNGRLYTTMMDKIVNFDIYDSVKEAYGTIYNGDETKIREEAIAKLIAAHVLNEAPLEESARNESIFKRWWNQVWDKIKGMFSDTTATAISPFVESAKILLSNNTEGLNLIEDVSAEAIQKGYKLTYYQTSSETLSERNRLSTEFKNNKIVAAPDGNGYVTLDSKPVLDRVSNYVKEYYYQVFRNSEMEEDAASTIAADKGTYIHKMAQLIMKDIIAGKSVNTLLNYSNFEEYRRVATREMTVESNYTRDETFAQLTEAQYQEIVSGVSTLYSQIQQNTNLLNESTGQDIKPEIFTELMLYDAKKDLAGTIDLLVLYPNGAVGIYDYKGIQFKQFGTETEDLPFYKLDAYDIQLGKYKEILREVYGVKEFAESRVVPINMQMNKKDGEILEAGFKKLEFGKKGTRDYLEQLPVAGELTLSKGLNESLTKMMNLRNSLKKRLKKDYTNLKLKERVNKLNRIIKKIQLEKDVEYVYREIAKLYDEFDKRELASSESPDYMDVDTLAEFLEYREYLEAFVDFSVNASDFLKELTEEKPGLEKSMRQIPHFLDTMKKRIDNKLIEHVNTIDSTDIRADVVGTDKLGRLFKQLHDFNQPMFKKMAKLVEIASEGKRQAINQLVEDISQKRDNLEEWAGKNGLTLYDAYRKLLNDQKNLVSQFETSYWNDFTKAKKDGDVKWITANTTLNTEEMERDRRAYFNVLDKEYINEKDFELRESKKNTWDNKFNFVSNPKSALAHRYNPYVQLKDNPARYSKEYKYVYDKGNEPLKEFYETIIDYNRQFNDMLDKPVRQGFVAEIKQDTVDRFAQVGFAHAAKFKQTILNNLQVREYDISEREIDANGKIVPSVPLLYTDKLNIKLSPSEMNKIDEEVKADGYEEGSYMYKNELSKRIRTAEYKKGNESKSIDLTTSLVLFAETAYTNKFFTDSEQTIKALQTLVHNKVADTQVVDATGKKVMDKIRNQAVKSLGLTKDDVEAFDKFVDIYWYGVNISHELFTWTRGRKLDENGKVIHEGVTYSGNKLVEMVMSYTSTKSLAFKPILAAGNAIGIMTNTYMIGAEGLYFNEKQLRNARNLVFGSALKKGSKAVAAIKFFEPSARNLTYEKANNLSGSKLTQWLTMDTAFILHKKPDDAVDAMILISMMQNYGMGADGKVNRLQKLPKDTKSLWDIAEFDGNKFSIPGFTQEQVTEQYNRFRRMVQAASTKIKGSIPDQNKSLIGSTMEGRILMQFRSWIPGLAATRFKRISYDPEMEELDVGRARVLFGEIARSRSLKDALKTFTTLLGEMMISAPGISRFTGSRTLYARGQNESALKFYYEKFLAENPELADEVSMDQYAELRQAKLKGMAKELSLLFSFIALTSMLKSMIPDEDESAIQQNFARNTYRIFNRGLLELLFWFDPTTVSQIMDKPVVSFSAFTDIAQWLGNTIDVTRDLFLDVDDPTRAVGSKGKKDKTPLFYRTSGMVPMVNTVYDWLNIWDKPLR